jgi:hypothetical protein
MQRGGLCQQSSVLRLIVQSPRHQGRFALRQSLLDRGYMHELPMEPSSRKLRLSHHVAVRGRVHRRRVNGSIFLGSSLRRNYLRLKLAHDLTERLISKTTNLGLNSNNTPVHTCRRFTESEEGYTNDWWSKPSNDVDFSHEQWGTSYVDPSYLGAVT